MDDILFEKSRLLSGIDKTARAVGATLGPSGKLSLIRSNRFTAGMTATKDGVTTASTIVLKDEVEEMGRQLLTQAASTVVREVGDNTSTAIVLADALIKELEKTKEKDISSPILMKYMDELVDEVLLYLKEIATPVDDLAHVAAISANNDAHIGQLIADAYSAVGKDGSVIVETNYNTPDTYTELIKGIELENCGFSAQGFSNHQDGTVQYENAKVLVYDGVIEVLEDLKGFISEMDVRKEPLVIVADMTPPLLQSMVVSKIKSGLKLVVVTPPALGFRRKDLLKDLAFMTGATYIDENTDDLSSCTMSDLGFTSNVKVTNKGSIFEVEPVSKKEVSKRVKELKQVLAAEQNESIKKFLVKRIAYLTSGLARIYVGAKTDTEQKELYDRIEDAVLACKAAQKGGVLAGGGVSYFDAACGLSEHIASSFDEEQVAAHILSIALTAPINKICENAGDDWSEIYAENDEVDFSHGWGYNALTGEYGDMMDMNIIDTHEGLKNALETAWSVAKTVYNIETIILS